MDEKEPDGCNITSDASLQLVREPVPRLTPSAVELRWSNEPVVLNHSIFGLWD